MNLDRTGRDGKLSLRFARRGSRTDLVRSSFTLPLQVLAPLAMEDGSAYLSLLNPTGGVLGGDRLTSEIVLEAGAHGCLTTPSATRVYRTDSLPAMLDTVMRVGEGATIEYFPDHLIPHPGAALRQSLRVEIAAGGRALLWEAMACGRVAREERWQFREIVSEVEILVCGKPVWLSRTKIDPAAFAPQRPGAAEAYAYSGSLAILADGFTRWPQLIAEMNRKLVAFPEVHAGVSKLAGDGCLVRLLANSAIHLTGMCTSLWAVGRAVVLDLPAFESRKY
ncbi:MAG: urease accessory protein UreD [Terracidiphilus sp.]